MAACTLLLCTAGRCSKLAGFAGKETSKTTPKKWPKKIKKEAMDVAPDAASAMQRSQADTTWCATCGGYGIILRQNASGKYAGSTLCYRCHGKGYIYINRRR